MPSLTDVSTVAIGRFEARFRAQFADPAFYELGTDLDHIATAAWDACDSGRKSPRTRKAGAEFADPDYELATDSLATRDAIAAAAAPARRTVGVAGGGSAMAGSPLNSRSSCRTRARARGTRPAQRVRIST